MFLPIQSPSLIRATDKAKVLREIREIALSQLLTEDAGNVIRCQICCADSVGESDRCKSEDNPYCSCLPPS